MKLAVVRDFQAERWPSMDLCADQLLTHLPAGITSVVVAPGFCHFFGLLPSLHRIGFNADRLLNRHILLPRCARRISRRVDFCHIVDHSYAHLVNVVPTGRAGVFCHDLDAFRSILEPEKETRPWWFRRLAQRSLDGLKQAVVIFHNTVEVGRQLVNAGIATEDRLVHAPLGVAYEFRTDTITNVDLPISTTHPFLLHVGSNIPRKRLDVLLDIFAAVRATIPGWRLVQVGGPWPTHLAEQIDRLGIGAHVIQLRNLTREQLAELYRRASAVLVTSEAEGFGLPVIEALACGAPVIASDIPTLREAGGTAASYCPVADISGWVNMVIQVLGESPQTPTRSARIEHAAKFSWKEHARIIGEAYLRLADQRR